MTEVKHEHRVSPIEKIGFGLGDTASNFVFQMFIMYLAYFYTDVFGITAAAMGTLFLAVRVLDAVTDPIMGAICDRTNTRWGKFRPYLLILALPYAVLAVMAFITPDFSATGKLIYAFITYSLLVIIYTAINIPYCALGGVITPDSHERVSLSSYRFFLAMAAGLLIAFTTKPFINWLGQGSERKGFPLAMAVFATLSFFMFIACFFLTKERVVPAVDKKSNLFEDLKILFANDQWLIVAILNFVFLMPIIIRGAGALYYLKWYAGRADLQNWFLGIGMTSAMFGAGFASPLTKRLSKVASYMLVQAIAVAVSIAFFFVRSDQLVLMFVLFVIVQFFTTVSTPILWAMMADTVDYGEWKTGRRITGLVFSGALFTLKLGMAVGGFILGLILAYSGYKSGEAVTSQTPEAIRGVVLIFTIIPAIGQLLLIGIVKFYKLSNERCAEIRAELDRRSQAAGDV